MQLQNEITGNVIEVIFSNGFITPDVEMAGGQSKNTGTGNAET